MNKVKICVVGPSNSGKTVLSNFISDQTDQIQSEYHPTVGVRILEFDCDVTNGNRSNEASVELWDCSGNPDYESCWPAMSADSDGIMIVYNPFNSAHSTEVHNWYNTFVAEKGMKDSQVLLIAYCRKKDASKNFPSPLPNVSFTIANLESDPDGIKDSFSKFLSKVVGRATASQEREERNILS